MNKLRAVLVDDSIAVRERLVRMFSEITSLEIVGEAGNLPDAISVIKKEKPDVVVVDISLPGENGIEVIKKINRTNSFDAIIVFTNYPGKQYKTECFKEGVKYYFNKTTEYDLLVNLLSELAEGTSSKII